ncbi:MAG TPA: hypothetical protein VGD65_06675 [Chryseosolibacter sp.]
MNRKSVMATLLATSLIVNVVLVVFAYVQKAEANHAREEAMSLNEDLHRVQREAKAELETCEGLRAQSDNAREECERKILAISNRK